MNTDKHGLKHSEVTQGIIGAFFEVYNELGAGFLESVYVESLAIALSQAGLSVQREKPLTVLFRGEVVGKFRADLIVGNVVLIESQGLSKAELLT